MHSAILRVKAVIGLFSKLPYRWAWIALMITSSLLFGWFDDVIIWTVGLAFAWWIVPTYYIVEYGVMLPLAILLFRKTAKKMNLQVSTRESMSKALSNTLPAIIYKRIKKKTIDHKPAS